MYEIEKEEDLRQVAQDLQNKLDYDEDFRNKDAMKKERNARVWIEQSNMKYKGREIETLFW